MTATTRCADCCYSEPNKAGGLYCVKMSLPCSPKSTCSSSIKKPPTKPKRELSAWEAAWAEWARIEVSNHS